MYTIRGRVRLAYEASRGLAEADRWRRSASIQGGQMIERTAIVTGAAQGLGEAIARALHRRKFRVVVADVNEECAAQVAASLGDGARAAVVDVSSRASFSRLLEETLARERSVDVLVNNAALTISTPFFDIDDDEWDNILAVNLRGVFIGCQLAGAHMRDRGWGRIVNMASLAGQQGGLVAGAHYAASKAGIVVVTKIAARILAPHGVTVNAVAPAAIAGPVMDRIPEERVRAIASSIPVGRIGTPAEVAALVSYLVSDEAGYVTGATFDINGGIFMR
jgi:3-oxoacyl-[acyl-carrier protein] reductase